MRRPSFVAALLLSVGVACASPPAADDMTPGVSEGTDGLLDVVVLDLDSRAPIASAQVTFEPVAPIMPVSVEGSTDDQGFVSFPRSNMSSFELTVEATNYVSAHWFGVVGGRVVVPLRRAIDRELFGVTVTGLAADEHAVVSITTRPALFQPSSVRVAGATGAAVAPCEDAGAAGCRAELDADAAPSGRLVLVAVLDAAGTARRLVRFDGVVDDDTIDLGAGEDLSFESLAGTVPATPVGLSAVVGVPGISFGSAVGVLGFESSSGTVTMPVVTGMLATRWALYVAHGDDAGTPVPSIRSVLVDRRVEAALGPWTSWLAPPEMRPIAGAAAFFAPSPGASIHVIDWVSSGGRVLRTDLRFDRPSALVPVEGAASVRIRAIDTTADPGSLRIDEAERATTRFAEIDVELP